MKSNGLGLRKVVLIPKKSFVNITDSDYIQHRFILILCVVTHERL